MYIYIYVYISLWMNVWCFFTTALWRTRPGPQGLDMSPGPIMDSRRDTNGPTSCWVLNRMKISQTGLKHLFSLKYPKIMKIALETPWRICLIANPDGEYSKNVFVRRPEYMTGTWALTIAQIALWSKETVYSNPRRDKRRVSRTSIVMFCRIVSSFPFFLSFLRLLQMLWATG